MSTHDSSTAPDSSEEPRTEDSTELDAAAHEAEGPAIPVVPPHVTKEIFASALRATLIMLVVLTVVGIGVGALVAGLPGVWAALLGVAVTLIFSGTTIASMLYTADKGPNVTMAMLLGGWIAKMLVLVILLAILGQMDFYHHMIFAVIVMIGVVGSAALDMLSVVRGRQPYVNPGATSEKAPR